MPLSPRFRRWERAIRDHSTAVPIARPPDAPPRTSSVRPACGSVRAWLAFPSPYASQTRRRHRPVPQRTPTPDCESGSCPRNLSQAERSRSVRPRHSFHKLAGRSGPPQSSPVPRAPNHDFCPREKCPSAVPSPDFPRPHSAIPRCGARTRTTCRPPRDRPGSFQWPS